MIDRENAAEPWQGSVNCIACSGLKASIIAVVAFFN